MVVARDLVALEAGPQGYSSPESKGMVGLSRNSRDFWPSSWALAIVKLEQWTTMDSVPSRSNGPILRLESERGETARKKQMMARARASPTVQVARI